MAKVVITARNYGIKDQTCLRILAHAGLEVENKSTDELSVGAPEDVIYEFVKDADYVIAGLEPYRETLLSRCPKLKGISRRGIGYDTVDTAACQKYGITLTRTFGEVEGAVAEHVMAYILYFSRRVDLQNADMQERIWKRVLMPGAKSRTLGLIGFGGIGKEIAKRAVPFGMKVVYYCRHPKKEWDEAYGVSYLPMEELLSVSDYISVNVPLTPETQGMIGEAEFAKMKDSAIFINIARGPVMDDEALAAALRSGKLGGAAVDVFPQEPYTKSPLVGCPNTVLTPHTAPFTVENFNGMNNVAAQNVVDLHCGSLQEKHIVVYGSR